MLNKQYSSIVLVLSMLSYIFISCGTEGGNDDEQNSSLSRESPYPQSPVIESITWDLDSHVHRAPGSDLWPVTWADDDNIYTSWGDGGGFGGTNTDGRVSLGFARIEGPPTNFVAVNVWGGKNAENPATFGGKSVGIISVDGVLYAWINLQNDAFPNVDFGLASSSDFGATWEKVLWVFPAGDGNFKAGTFLNFGRDYTGARDNFVYFYGRKQGDDINAYMGRVPKDKLEDREFYEFFSGLNPSGDPTWTSDVNGIAPVFSDPNGTDAGQVVYNPVIERYIRVTTHGNAGQVGVFDAPEPWGPWTTVAYYDNWIGAGGGSGLVKNFANKWTSADGLTMWMVFSCYNCVSKYHDRFNLIKATLTLKTP